MWVLGWLGNHTPKQLETLNPPVETLNLPVLEAPTDQSPCTMAAARLDKDRMLPPPAHCSCMLLSPCTRVGVRKPGWPNQSINTYTNTYVYLSIYIYIYIRIRYTHTM